MDGIINADLLPALSIVNVNLPVFMFNEHFADFVKHGITPEIGLDCLALDNTSPDEMRAYAAKLHNAGLRPSMHAPFIGLEPGSDDPAKRAKARHYLEKALDVVAIFKPAQVVWHTCLRRQAPYDDPGYFAVFAERLCKTSRWFAQELQARGARLMLENVFELDAKLHLMLLKELEPHNTGFCLDTGHSHAFTQKPLNFWLESGLAPYLGEIHLHDNDGTQDAHLGAGSGSVDFAPLLRHWRTLPQNKRPLLTLEPHTPRDLLLSLNFVKKNFCNNE